MYGLVDTETSDLIGEHPTLEAALRVVAAAARRYGPDAPEVAALSLARLDGALDEAFVAEGADLVQRAMTLPVPGDEMSAEKVGVY